MRERTPSAAATPKRAPLTPPGEASIASVKTLVVFPTTKLSSMMLTSAHNPDDLGVVAHPTKVSNDRQQQQQQDKSNHIYRSAQTAQDKRSRLSNVINNLRKKVPDTSCDFNNEEGSRSTVERNLKTLEKYVMTVLNRVIKDDDESNRDIAGKETKDDTETYVLDEDTDTSVATMKLEKRSDDNVETSPEPSKPNESVAEAAVPLPEEKDEEGKNNTNNRNQGVEDSRGLQHENDIVDNVRNLGNSEDLAMKVILEAVESQFHSQTSTSPVGDKGANEKKSEGPLENAIPHETDSNDQESAEEKKEIRSLGAIILERLGDHCVKENADEGEGNRANSSDAEATELRTICKELLNDLVNDINQLIDENSVENEDAEGSVGDSRTLETSITSFHCSVPLDKIASVLQSCSSPGITSQSLVKLSMGTVGTVAPAATVAKPPSPTVRHLCLYCDRKFLSISLRQRHTERVHQLGGGRRSERNSRKPSQNCQYCSDKCAESLEGLFQHMVGKHSDKYHACVQCTTRYVTREALMGHMNDVHSSALERSHQVQEKPKESSPVKETSSPSTKEKNDLTNSKERRLEEDPKPLKQTYSATKDVFSNPGSPEFDSSFYSSVSCNIRENLLHHLDGKIQAAAASPVATTITTPTTTTAMTTTTTTLPTPSASSPASSATGMTATAAAVTTHLESKHQSFYEHGLNQIQFPIDISLTAATPVYNKEYNTSEEQANSSEYAQKPGKSNRTQPRRVSFEKYNFPRKYDGKEQWTCSIKDLSKFDISTQLTLRKKQQLLKEKLTFDRLHLIPFLGPSNSEVNQTDIEISEKTEIGVESRSELPDENESLYLGSSVDNSVKTAETDPRIANDTIKSPAFPNETLQIEESSDTPKSCTGQHERTTVSPPNFTEFSAEFTNFLKLRKWDDGKRQDGSKTTDAVYAELTGEWSRPRIYICGACTTRHVTLREMEDHKAASHPNVWCSHFEFSGDQRELYKHLFLPGRSVPTSKAKNAELLEKICTKCSKNCNSLAELHRHMLECGGDQAWLLGLFGNGKKKCKWRPFGSRSRRRRQRGMKRNIQNSQSPRVNQAREKQQPTGPRVRPSDRESIQKMLANLPAKRATRKVLQQTSTRSHGRLRRVQTRSRPRLVTENSSASRLSRNKAALRNKLLKNAKSIQRNRCGSDNLTAVIESVVNNCAVNGATEDVSENHDDNDPIEGSSQSETTKNGRISQTKRDGRSKVVGVLGKRRNVKVKESTIRNVEQSKLSNKTSNLKLKRKLLAKNQPGNPKNSSLQSTIKLNSKKSKTISPSSDNSEDRSDSDESSSKSSKTKRWVDPVASLNASIKAKLQLRTRDGKFARSADKKTDREEKSPEPEVDSVSSSRQAMRRRRTNSSSANIVSRTKLRIARRTKNNIEASKRITRLSSDSDRMPTLEPVLQSASNEEQAEKDSKDLPVLLPATSSSSQGEQSKSTRQTTKTVANASSDVDHNKSTNDEVDVHLNKSKAQPLEEREPRPRGRRPKAESRNLERDLKSNDAETQLIPAKCDNPEEFHVTSRESRAKNRRSLIEKSVKGNSSKTEKDFKLSENSSTDSKESVKLHSVVIKKPQVITNSLGKRKVRRGRQRSSKPEEESLKTRNLPEKDQTFAMKSKKIADKLIGKSKRMSNIRNNRMKSTEENLSLPSVRGRRKTFGTVRKSRRNMEKQEKLVEKDTSENINVADNAKEIGREMELVENKANFTDDSERTNGEKNSLDIVSSLESELKDTDSKNGLPTKSVSLAQSENVLKRRSNSLGKRRGRIKSNSETTKEENLVSPGESDKNLPSIEIEKCKGEDVIRRDEESDEENENLPSNFKDVQWIGEGKDVFAKDLVHLSLENLQQESNNSNIDSGKENTLEASESVSKLKVVRPKKTKGLRRERITRRSLSNVIGILTEGVNIPIEVQQSVVLTVQTSLDNSSPENMQNTSEQRNESNTAGIERALESNNLESQASENTQAAHPEQNSHPEQTNDTSIPKEAGCENTAQCSTKSNDDNCCKENIGNRQPESKPLDSQDSKSVTNDIILDLTRRKPKGKGSFLEKIVSKIARQKDALLEGDVGSLLDHAADELTSILDEVHPSFAEGVETADLDNNRKVAEEQPSSQLVKCEGKKREDSLANLPIDESSGKSKRTVTEVDAQACLLETLPENCTTSVINETGREKVPDNSPIFSTNGTCPSSKKFEDEGEKVVSNGSLDSTATSVMFQVKSANINENLIATEKDLERGKTKAKSKKRSLETNSPKKNKKKSVDPEEDIEEDTSAEEVCLANLMKMINTPRQPVHQTSVVEKIDEIYESREDVIPNDEAENEASKGKTRPCKRKSTVDNEVKAIENVSVLNPQDTVPNNETTDGAKKSKCENADVPKKSKQKSNKRKSKAEEQVALQQDANAVSEFTEHLTNDTGENEQTVQLSAARTAKQKCENNAEVLEESANANKPSESTRRKSKRKSHATQNSESILEEVIGNLMENATRNAVPSIDIVPTSPRRKSTRRKALSIEESTSEEIVPDPITPDVPISTIEVTKDLEGEFKPTELEKSPKKRGRKKSSTSKLELPNKELLALPHETAIHAKSDDDNGNSCPGETVSKETLNNDDVMGTGISIASKATDIFTPPKPRKRGPKKKGLANELPKQMDNVLVVETNPMDVTAVPQNVKTCTDEVQKQENVNSENPNASEEGVSSEEIRATMKSVDSDVNIPESRESSVAEIKTEDLPLIPGSPMKKQNSKRKALDEKIECSDISKIQPDAATEKAVNVGTVEPEETEVSKVQAKEETFDFSINGNSKLEQNSNIETDKTEELKILENDLISDDPKQSGIEEFQETTTDDSQSLPGKLEPEEQTGDAGPNVQAPTKRVVGNFAVVHTKSGEILIVEKKKKLTKEAPRFFCDICATSFTRKSSLKKHNLSQLHRVFLLRASQVKDKALPSTKRDDGESKEETAENLKSCSDDVNEMKCDEEELTEKSDIPAEEMVDCNLGNSEEQMDDSAEMTEAPQEALEDKLLDEEICKITENMTHDEYVLTDHISPVSLEAVSPSGMKKESQVEGNKQDSDNDLIGDKSIMEEDFDLNTLQSAKHLEESMKSQQKATDIPLAKSLEMLQQISNFQEGANIAERAEAGSVDHFSEEQASVERLKENEKNNRGSKVKKYNTKKNHEGDTIGDKEKEWRINEKEHHTVKENCKSVKDDALIEHKRFEFRPRKHHNASNSSSSVPVRSKRVHRKRYADLSDYIDFDDDDDESYNDKDPEDLENLEKFLGKEQKENSCSEKAEVLEELEHPREDPAVSKEKDEKVDVMTANDIETEPINEKIETFVPAETDEKKQEEQIQQASKHRRNKSKQISEEKTLPQEVFPVATRGVEVKKADSIKKVPELRSRRSGSEVQKDQSENDLNPEPNRPNVRKSTRCRKTLSRQYADDDRFFDFEEDEYLDALDSLILEEERNNDKTVDVVPGKRRRGRPSKREIALRNERMKILEISKPCNDNKSAKSVTSDSLELEKEQTPNENNGKAQLVSQANENFEAKHHADIEFENSTSVTEAVTTTTVEDVAITEGSASDKEREAQKDEQCNVAEQPLNEVPEPLGNTVPVDETISNQSSSSFADRPLSEFLATIENQSNQASVPTESLDFSNIADKLKINEVSESVDEPAKEFDSDDNSSNGEVSAGIQELLTHPELDADLKKDYFENVSKDSGKSDSAPSVDNTLEAPKTAEIAKEGNLPTSDIDKDTSGEASKDANELIHRKNVEVPSVKRPRRQGEKLSKRTSSKKTKPLKPRGRRAPSKNKEKEVSVASDFSENENEVESENKCKIVKSVFGRVFGNEKQADKIAEPTDWNKLENDLSQSDSERSQGDDANEVLEARYDEKSSKRRSRSSSGSPGPKAPAKRKNRSKDKNTLSETTRRTQSRNSRGKQEVQQDRVEAELESVSTDVASSRCRQSKKRAEERISRAFESESPVPDDDVNIQAGKLWSKEISFEARNEEQSFDSLEKDATSLLDEKEFGNEDAKKNGRTRNMDSPVEGKQPCDERDYLYDFIDEDDDNESSPKTQETLIRRVDSVGASSPGQSSFAPSSIRNRSVSPDANTETTQEDTGVDDNNDEEDDNLEEDMTRRRLSPLLICGASDRSMDSSSNSEEEIDEEEELGQREIRKRGPSSEFSGDKVIIRSPPSNNKDRPEVVTIAPTDAIEDNASDVPQDIESTSQKSSRQGKVLNFDEELFVECCSRLKATTENELRGAKKIKLDHSETFHRKEDPSQNFRSNRDRWRDVESQNSLGSLLESVNQLLGEEMYSTGERDYSKRGRNLRSEHSSRSASPVISRPDNLGYEDSLDVAFEHNNKLRDKIQQRMRESENLIASTFGQKIGNLDHQDDVNCSQLKGNEHDGNNRFSYKHSQLSTSSITNGDYGEHAAIHSRNQITNEQSTKSMDTSEFKSKMNSALGGFLDKALSNLLHSNGKHDNNGSTPMKVLAELACARAPTSTTSDDIATQPDESLSLKASLLLKEQIPEINTNIPRSSHFQKARNPIKELFEKKKELNERKQQQQQQQHEKLKNESTLREINIPRQKKTKKLRKQQEFPLIRRNERGGLVERKKRREFSSKKDDVSGKVKDVYDFDEEESQIEPEITAFRTRIEKNYDIGSMKTKDIDMEDLVSKTINSTLENGKAGDVLGKRLESMIDRKFREIEKFAPKTKGALKSFQSEDKHRQDPVTGPMDEFVEKRQRTKEHETAKHSSTRGGRRRNKNFKRRSKSAWYENDSSDEFRTAAKAEDVGVGISKSQRTCSKGKQNLFAELSTSSESEFEGKKTEQLLTIETPAEITEDKEREKFDIDLEEENVPLDNIQRGNWVDISSLSHCKSDFEAKKSESELSDHPLIIDERKDSDEQRNSDDEADDRVFEMDDLYREDSSVADSDPEESNIPETLRDEINTNSMLTEEDKRHETSNYCAVNSEELIPVEEALEMLDNGSENLGNLFDKVVPVESLEVNESNKSMGPTNTVALEQDDIEDLQLPEKLSSNEKPQNEPENLPLHVFLSRKVQESKKRKQQQLKKMQEEQEKMLLMDCQSTRRQRKCAIGKQGLLAEISSSDEELFMHNKCRRSHEEKSRRKRESKEKRKERYIEKKHEQMIAKEQRAIEEEILREVGKKKDTPMKDSADEDEDQSNGETRMVGTDVIDSESFPKKSQQSVKGVEDEPNGSSDREGLSESTEVLKNVNEPPKQRKSLKSREQKSRKSAKGEETPRRSKARSGDRKSRSSSSSVSNKDKERRMSSTKRDSGDEELKTTKSWNRVEEGVGVAIGRRKRAAANQLYYWSSSSDEEEMIEPAPVVEEEEDDRQEQHGWIVGDSHKRMITMLAMEKQLKEKRRRSEDEFEASKTKNKKHHRNSTS